MTESFWTDTDTDTNTGDVLTPLNDAQQAAVIAPPGNMLVVAGAGTGKTRVLVSRVIWLLTQGMVSPRQVLALTFTNKAAREMRDRIAAAYPVYKASSLWVYTFHALCARLLRLYSYQAGLHPDFTIMDAQGQVEMIKDCFTHQQLQKLEKDHITCESIAAVICRFKEQGLRAEAALKLYAEESSIKSAKTRYALQIYAQYEQLCQDLGRVDFSELLLRTVELLECNADVREQQHQRFREILVDEFQDTNSLQYALLQLLCGPQCHIFAVGDDDQSIYGWRGADFTNMQRFLHDFSDVAVHRLTQNYRSSARILDAANALIGHNKERITDKELVSVKDKGSRIDVHSFPNNYAEADYIAAAAAKLIREQNVMPSDIAVLYRNNSCACALEQAMTNFGIAYQVHGGQHFFARREIQDTLAYLRLVLSFEDDTAFSQAIAVPPHDFGPRKLQQLSVLAADRQCSLFEALIWAVEVVDAASAKKDTAKKSAAKKEAVAKEAAATKEDSAAGAAAERTEAAESAEPADHADSGAAQTVATEAAAAEASAESSPQEESAPAATSSDTADTTEGADTADTAAAAETAHDVEQVDEQIKELAHAARSFVQQIRHFAQLHEDHMPVTELVQTVLKESGLLKFYEAIDRKEKYKDNRRLQNLQELVENARTIEAQEQASPTLDDYGKPFSPLLMFVNNAACLASYEQNDFSSRASKDPERVQLSTIHSAKGLEFGQVFLSDFEHNILPGFWSNGNIHAEEEERRLAYVAITRAKSKLVICYARERFSPFSSHRLTTGPSMFLQDIAGAMDKKDKKLFKDSFSFTKHESKRKGKNRKSQK